MVTEVAAHAIDVPGAADAVSYREGLEEIACIFHQQLNPARLHPGAALAVYHNGRLVLDLAAGFADTQGGHLVRSDTLFSLFSGTKPFSSVALLPQIEP